MTKPKYGGYVHLKKSQRKRPVRHAKNHGKRIPKRSKTRGQG